MRKQKAGYKDFIDEIARGKIREELNMNINKIKLNEKDENRLQESIRMMKKLPFVEKIEFEENDPTILVKLSDMDIQTIKRIHEIEYDLTQNFEECINFVVSPIC